MFLGDPRVVALLQPWAWLRIPFGENEQIDGRSRVRRFALGLGLEMDFLWGKRVSVAPLQRLEIVTWQA